jgi:hypothetical protein
LYKENCKIIQICANNCIYIFVVKEAWAKGVQLVASNNIHYVVDNYVHAITAQWPRARYHCGWDAILVWIPLSLMPTMLQDYIIRFLTQYQPGPPLMPVALQN